MLVALIPNTFAYQVQVNRCVHLNDGKMFDVTELSNICFTKEFLSINIINSGKNTDVYISDNLEMVALGGGKYIRVGHAFYLSSDALMELIVEVEILLYLDKKTLLKH